MRGKSVDTPFLIIILALLTLGFAVFLSASVGLLARDGAGVSRVILNQAVFGIGFGLFLAWVMSNIQYEKWKSWAFFIFTGAFIASFLVFLPGLGFEHGGGRRWIDLGFITIQPAEFLKLASVIFAAMWFSSIKKNVEDWRRGLLPVLLFLGLIAIPFILQPDIDSLVVTAFAVIAMYFIAGAPWKHILSIVLLGIIGASILIFSSAYIRDRITTFINPNVDPSGASWQIRQSLIAIGSGGMFGKGLGQSVQKFGYLPEPIGDSIFAVAAEEFGFMGAMIIIILFFAFLARGLFLARRIPDAFGGLLLSGIVIMIVFQSFFNIGAMLGLLPLSGLPLLFISKGGTAMLMVLIASGIALSITRHRQKTA